MGGDGEVFVARHLQAAIPGERFHHLVRQVPNLFDESIYNSRRVLRWNLDQHRKPRLPLNERRDVSAVRTHDQVSLPMPRDGTVLDLGRSLADRDGIDDPLLRSIAQTGMPRFSHRALGSQMSDKFFLEHTAGLDEEASINRLVGNLHLQGIRILSLEPSRYLFGRPF